MDSRENDMSKGKTRMTEDGRLCFWCPGCQEVHAVPVPRWQWNGDRERPTLIPSVKISSGHYADGHTGTCWCTYNTEHADEPAPFKCGICHFHLTNGVLAYCADSTHAYANKHVELEVWE